MITWCGVSKEVRRGGEDGGGEISVRRDKREER